MLWCVLPSQVPKSPAVLTGTSARQIENTVRFPLVLRTTMHSQRIWNALLTDLPDVLRKALFRGGLNPKTLQTLIETDDDVDETEEPRVTQTTTWENLFSYPTSVAVTITKPPAEQPTPDKSEPNVGIAGFLSRPRVDCNRSASFATTDSYTPAADDEDDDDDGTGKKPRKNMAATVQACY